MLIFISKGFSLRNKERNDSYKNHFSLLAKMQVVIFNKKGAYILQRLTGISNREDVSNLVFVTDSVIKKRHLKKKCKKEKRVLQEPFLSFMQEI